jgi:hypothetical protein
MIVEAAFYKLPELLTSRFDHEDIYEGTLLSSFASCVLMELDARNVPNTYQHVVTEKPYPTMSAGGRRWRADLLIKLESAINLDGRRLLYGMRPLAWIELKGLFQSTRSSSTPPKTQNAGALLRDVLRVCLLPEEFQGRIRQNARYILVVFANPPSDSLPFGDRSRSWLEPLFTLGESDIEIHLGEEPEKLRVAVGAGLVDGELAVKLRIRTHVFVPQGTVPSPVFWGYLIRVEAFTVTTPMGEIMLEDRPDDDWSARRVDQLSVVRGYVVDRIRRAPEKPNAR